MNSAGAVALFVYAFIALTQLVLRNRMSEEVKRNLQIRMWLHPWLAYLVIAMVVGVVIVMIALGGDSLWQVVLSLACFLLLLVLWPIVHRNAKASGAIPEDTPLFGRAPGEDALDPAAILAAEQAAAEEAARRAQHG